MVKKKMKIGALLILLMGKDEGNVKPERPLPTERIFAPAVPKDCYNSFKELCNRTSNIKALESMVSIQEEKLIS